MRQYIVTRVLDTAAYMLKTGATVRDCAQKLGVSKTTVHKDMRVRLPLIDPQLARSVGRVLGINMSERHIRGGEATRKKYEEMAL
ncbi:sporulation transcriptional regulator SpoIIID [Eubacteriales bacterium OttesenSCG-928-N13]|nr:sporulation transcriptional regulator SpoIIID [Eubacteriales bacterium OttesenSCG-928-N13]